MGGPGNPGGVYNSGGPTRNNPYPGGMSGSQYGSAQGARGMLTEDFESRIEKAVERGIRRGLGGAIG